MWKSNVGHFRSDKFKSTLSIMQTWSFLRGSEFWKQASRLNFAPNSFFDEVCVFSFIGRWDQIPNCGPFLPAFLLAQFGKARCVQVDAEPKVIASAVAECSQIPLAADRGQDDPVYGIFRKNNICYEQSGRGNNWVGFHVKLKLFLKMY